MWAAIKSPLIMGHDVTKQSAATLEILTNKNIIDLSQGAWNIVTRTYVEGNIQVWQQSNTKGVDRVVIIINLGASDQQLVVPFNKIFVDDKSTTYTVTELWTNVVTKSVGAIAPTVKTHGVWVGRFSPTGGNPVEHERRAAIQNGADKGHYQQKARNCC
ncbi:Alpha-galactosidase [Dactylellina cionopaga]|nr:Alpha-galactosidase [Dactylellina cionopaga]